MKDTQNTCPRCGAKAPFHTRNCGSWQDGQTCDAPVKDIQEPEQDTSLVKEKPSWEQFDKMYRRAVDYIVEFRERAEKAEQSVTHLTAQLAEADRATIKAALAADDAERARNKAIAQVESLRVQLAEAQARERVLREFAIHQFATRELFENLDAEPSKTRTEYIAKAEKKVEQVLPSPTVVPDAENKETEYQARLNRLGRRGA